MKGQRVKRDRNHDAGHHAPEQEMTIIIPDHTIRLRITMGADAERLRVWVIYVKFPCSNSRSLHHGSKRQKGVMLPSPPGHATVCAPVLGRLLLTHSTEFVSRVETAAHPLPIGVSF